MQAICSENILSYRAEFSLTLYKKENGELCLTLEGVGWDKYFFLKFEAGFPAKAKIYYKTYTGVIKKITKKYVYITIDGKDRKHSLADFALLNYHTRTFIRIEKNGIGPYQTKKENLSEAMLQWREKQSNLFQRRREEGISHVQPSPDISFSEYNTQAVCHNCLFAFEDHKQLFEWFSLEEVSFLVKEGYEITVKQEGVDFEDYIYSRDQIAYLKKGVSLDKIERRYW